MYKKINKTTGRSKTATSIKSDTNSILTPLSNNESGNNKIYFRKPDARKTASIRNAKLMKERKLKNLINEVEKKRAILKRGYYIIKHDDNSVSHRKLDSAEKEFVRKDREKLKTEIYELKSELKDLSFELKIRAQKTVRAHQQSLNKLRKDRKVKTKTNQILAEIDKTMKIESQNGQAEKLRQIQILEDSDQKRNEMMNFLINISKFKFPDSIEQNLSAKNKIVDKSINMLDLISFEDNNMENKYNV